MAGEGRNHWEIASPRAQEAPWVIAIDQVASEGRNKTLAAHWIECRRKKRNLVQTRMSEDEDVSHPTHLAISLRLMRKVSKAGSLTQRQV